MKLDIKAIEHLAVLAKLRLSPGEAEVYGRQLTEVLGHLDNLKEASDFIEQHQLDGSINCSQAVEPDVDLSADEVAVWPPVEVGDCLAMTKRQVSGEIVIPQIK